MSYCRWSSDNFRSDVYVYAAVDGSWTTHVAARRRKKLETLPPSPYDLVGKVGNDEWLMAYRKYHAALDKLPFEKIDLPHAGDTFRDSSPEEAADTLRMLRSVGYHVPDGVIEELESEAESMSQEASDV